MKLNIEHHYQHKYLEMGFEENVVIATDDDVLGWRQAWLQSLASWHSPYKAIIDGSNLRIQGDKESLKSAFSRMDKLLKGFFLKKAIVFGLTEEESELLPFERAKSRDEAFTKAGIRSTKKAVPGDFRSCIQVQNHFRQHVMEVSFSEDVTIETSDQLKILKDKITNNLMQWHSAWNLLFDCSHLEMSETLNSEFERMLTFFRGFFLKEVLGYTPKTKLSQYPFKVYRSRHNAAGRLENEGNISGNDANCQTRK